MDGFGRVAVVRAFDKQPFNTRKLKDPFGEGVAGGYAPVAVVDAGHW